jgi:hypothetical protein
MAWRHVYAECYVLLVMKQLGMYEGHKLLFVSLSEVSGYTRLLCILKIIAHVQQILLNF